MGLVKMIYLKNGDHFIPPYRGVGLIGFGPRAIKSAFHDFGFFGFSIHNSSLTGLQRCQQPVQLDHKRKQQLLPGELA